MCPGLAGCPGLTCCMQVFVSTCLFWRSELQTWGGGQVLELALSAQGLERLKDRKVKTPRCLFIKCLLLDPPAPWEPPGLLLLPFLPCSLLITSPSSVLLGFRSSPGSFLLSPWFLSRVSRPFRPLLGDLPGAFLVSRAPGRTFCSHCHSCSRLQSSPDGPRVCRVHCALLLGTSCTGPAVVTGISHRSIFNKQ